MASVSAVQVGSFFVQQYYQVLQQQPDFVHQFYTDESTMLRIDGNTSESATAMLQIHSLIMSLNFTGIEIKSAHSLDSWNRGVIVMVSGSVQTKDYGERRKFVQTFFLAPQEKGYFVLNDIFHFLEEEQIHQHQAAMLAHSHFDLNANASNPLPEPVSDYLPVVEPQAREFVAPAHVEENDSVDQYSLPEQQPPQLQHQVPEDNNVVEEGNVEELAASFSHAMNSVQEPSPVPVEEPVGEPQKHTYASILRVAKGPSTAPVVPQRSVNKSNTPTSEWNHASQPAQQYHTATSTVSERPTAEATEEITAHDEEGEGRSVYVKNLGPTVSASDIEQEFVNFGTIKPEGVVLRNRKDVGVCYAFVEFEDAIGAQNAIKASPIQLAGRHVYIEERRPNSSGISRGRGRGRGRGGYPTETSRGRGSFGNRSYARGSGDGYDRDSNRPGGNGYYNRRGPSQERGILGNHVTRDGQSSFDDAA